MSAARRAAGLLALVLTVHVSAQTGREPPAGEAFEPLSILQHLHFPSDTEVPFTQQQLNPLLKSVRTQAGVMSKSSRGLVMRITSPRYEERILLNGTVVRKRRPAGDPGAAARSRHMILDEKRPSHLVLLALQALLDSNVTRLQQYFHISGSGDPGHWQIELTPIAPPVRAQLTRLQLFGGQHQLTRFRSERVDAKGNLSHWLDVRIQPST